MIFMQWEIIGSGAKGWIAPFASILAKKEFFYVGNNYICDIRDFNGAAGGF